MLKDTICKYQQLEVYRLLSFYEVYTKIKNELLLNPEKAYTIELFDNIGAGKKYVDKYLISDDFKKIDTGIVLTEIDLGCASGVDSSYYDSRDISV